MVRNSVKILLVIGIILIASFSLLRYLYVYYPSSEYKGEKAIAYTKAREYFFWKGFPWTILPLWGVDIIGEKNLTLFHNHKLYSAIKVTGMLPPTEGVVIAVGKDGKAFVLPNEFNKVIKREKIEVNSKEKALKVAFAYVESSTVYAKVKLLYNVSSIPGLSPNDWCYQNRKRCRIEHERLKNIIKPPKVSFENNSYISTFFTWKSIGGYVEKWKLKVEKDGAVTVLAREAIAKGIGASFLLQ